MRPRKRILLIDKNEDRRAELAFVLDVRGYRIISHPRGEIAVIVAHWPIAFGIAKKLKEKYPEAPLLVLAPCAESFPRCPHADVMMWANVSRYELLDKLHFLAVRKRGPKKGYKRVLAKVAA